MSNFINNAKNKLHNGKIDKNQINNKKLNKKNQKLNNNKVTLNQKFQMFLLWLN